MGNFVLEPDSQRAADGGDIDGTVIEPGDTFSFNDSVGPRTVERGLPRGPDDHRLAAPALDRRRRLPDGDDPFNNAFELGLPILQRYNHSFYISHYPMGRDATVSGAGLDFAFRNDLASAILIKTSYTDATLTFSFYGLTLSRVADTGPQLN